MPVSLDVIAQISRVVAAETDLVDLIIVASTSAEANRVELLVTLARRDIHSRRVLLNLSRREPAVFERQLRARLHELRGGFRPTLGLVPRPRQTQA